jgi:hypothetical protein
VTGDTPLRLAAAEFVGKQTGVHNFCEAAVPDQPLNCDAATVDAIAKYRGATIRPAFETDQARVLLLQFQPAASITVGLSKLATVLIVLNATEAETLDNVPVFSRAENPRGVLRAGDVVPCPSASSIEIHNTGKTAARLLAIELKNVQ